MQAKRVVLNELPDSVISMFFRRKVCLPRKENEDMSRIIDIISQLHFQNKEVWINEAKFGFKYLQDFCRDLKQGSTVLEIGCGSGILMAMLCEKNEFVDFEGLEPFGEGFQSLSELNSFLQAKGMKIHEVKYENYEVNKKYDLIYLVNVFEHLCDWRQFLKFLEFHLSEQGVCVVLCPNYNFPYESHFRIPVIWNKCVTGKVFKRFIRSYENKNNCVGLWKSLNFVKLNEVKAQIKHMRLTLKINNKITEDLIGRISRDEEFRKRQKAVGVIGWVMKKFGVTKAFQLRVFENFQPYMMLEIRLKNDL